MDVERMLLDFDLEGITYLTNYDYAEAIIGFTEDHRLIYDFEKMVDWLVKHEGFEELDAIEWIEYNTIRALRYMGESAPIIMYPLEKEIESWLEYQKETVNT